MTRRLRGEKRKGAAKAGQRVRKTKRKRERKVGRPILKESGDGGSTLENRRVRVKEEEKDFPLREG